MGRTSAYYSTTAWYHRVDAVRSRARGRCEFCQHRRMQHCHHRTYAHFGNEPLSDCMAVCAVCHRAIHGLLPLGTALTCRPDSLLALGDSGMGLTARWMTYLATQKELVYG